MKKFGLLLLFIPFVFISCSNDEAEKAAEVFHNKLNDGDIEYIMDNLVDTEYATEAELSNFRNVLVLMHSWGEHKNRVSTGGFNRGYHNGISTVKLSYTVDIQEQPMHERLVMSKTDDGYKVLAVAINPDESVVEQFAEQY
ncbi:hypothetical protein K6119_16360 [Paracrocinitomix mangrovi]|uniref:hypothetical protein n=1 Tax=Paracrocinitomix mangrovi TaxID=2862509 RepID=UPI001C8E67C2|nr:hypothetical protein [Paracrocinitomix mangrovi]UKN01302.1 hypothetical protein K6119_16360 [Paracrocinitomix mangrovi]